MIRSHYALLLFTAATSLGVVASGCNSPSCGPGTIQRQQANGVLECVPVDVPQQLTQCDVDGGNVEFSMGKCVSRIKCDPANTDYDPATGICTGRGGTVGSCTPCPSNPGTGKICLSGDIFDFVTNTKLTDGQYTMRVAAYEPLLFLSNPNTPPLTETSSTTKNCYTLTDIPAPAAGLVAIGISDPAGTTKQVIQLSGAGASVVAGKSYHVDISVVTKAQVDTWSADTGLNLDASGAYVGLFYSDPVPPDRTNLANNETHPVSGVQLVIEGTPVPNTKYLDPTRAKGSASLTATGALGASVGLPQPGVNTYSGKGGMCNGVPCVWEKHPGGSAPHVVFIDHFHDCTATPTAPTCM